MMAVCPVCGKLTAIHWPENWVWKRGSSYYCGENCISIDITRDIKTLNEVQRRRRSALIMAKLKKDGTPAKKPGPKPKKVIETPEGEFAQVKIDGPIRIETPEPEKVKVAVVTPEGPKDAGDLIRENRYTVTAISYPEIGEFYHDRKFNSIDWRTTEGDEVSMSPTGWKTLAKDLPEIMKVLGVEL